MSANFLFKFKQLVSWVMDRSSKIWKNAKNINFDQSVYNYYYFI